MLHVWPGGGAKEWHWKTGGLPTAAESYLGSQSHSDGIRELLNSLEHQRASVGSEADILSGGVCAAGRGDGRLGLHALKNNKIGRTALVLIL